jgi:GTP-binding protein HflX
VWNKIDAAGLEPVVERDEYDKISRVFISARTGVGLDLLRGAITEAAKSAPGMAYLYEEADGTASPDPQDPPEEALDSQSTFTQAGSH